MMESPSPVQSTPINGLTLQSKWTLHSEVDRVRKKLFKFEAVAADDAELNQWSSSSEQSANETSYLSGDNRTSFLDRGSPNFGAEEMSDLLTPNPSPSKRPPLYISTPPQLLKRQRLFSPSSPVTPDKYPVNFHSPVRPSPRPFLDTSCDSLTALNEMAAHDASRDDIMVTSPPRLERLQLLDYPCTPLSIARSSGLQVPPNGSASDCPRIGRGSGKAYSRIKRRLCRSGPELVRYHSRGTNINPFTPSELQKRDGPDGKTLLTSSRKRLALRESNISRYREEFHEVGVVGRGTFGTVYKCINRLDGCVYALKRSHKPVAGSADEAAALREVCAHAVLGSHQHLVRYYSAWAEENHMLIQNEFCDGGNLSSRIAENGVFGEVELQVLLRDVSMGLQHIHSMALVHMDIKPDNIFISSIHKSPIKNCNSSMEAILEYPAEETGRQFVYKIGDMGHVASISDCRVEEGDSRYLPREILQDNYSHLPKADIFSLGLTVFHAGSGVELPKNGDYYQKIRDGELPSLPGLSEAFNNLLKVMIHPNPVERPTPTELLSIICPARQKSKAQLCKELNEEKFKNEILQRELEVARRQQGLDKLNGPRLNRSMSIT